MSTFFVNGRTPVALLMLAGLLLTGCADARAPRDLARNNSQTKDPLAAWKEASRRMAARANAEQETPRPEPKLAPVTHFSAAVLYEKQCRYPLAIEQYRKAIELNDRFEAAYGRLGLCYIKTAQYRLARDTLTRAAKLQPRSVVVWNNLGFACLADNDVPAAEAALTKALAVKPGYQRARMNMALALVRQGRDAQAFSNLRAVGPDYIARYNLGTMQMAAGRVEAARASLNEALSIRANFPAARKALEKANARLAMAKAPEPSQDAATHAAVPSPSSQPSAPVAQAKDTAQDAVVSQNDTPKATVVPAAAQLPFRHAVPQGHNLDWECPVKIGRLPAEPAPVTPAIADASTVRTVVADVQHRTSRSDDSLAWTTVGWPLCSHNREAVTPGPAANHKTSCQPATPPDGVSTSLADLDLMSLQWFAWCRTLESMHTDIRHLSQPRLVVVMHKWLNAMDRIRPMTMVGRSAVAMAQ